MGPIKPLSEVRKGEIALSIIKLYFANKAQTLNRTDVMRNISEVAEELKGQITEEELLSLYKEVIAETVEKIFR